MRSNEPAGRSAEFEGIIDALPGMVWTTRADGRCDFANCAISDYTGLAEDGLLNEGWWTVIHPDDRAATSQAWDNLSVGQSPGPIDARLRRSDGQYRWFALRHSPLPGETPQAERWCWLASDADEYPATDGRVRRMFDMLPIQAGFLDASGVLEFTNLQSLRDFNMTKEELEAWTTSGVIHVDDHASTVAAVTKLLTTGEKYDEELRMLHPTKGYRWTRAQCVPWRDAEGNVVRYISFQIDVDDLRQAEALLAAEVRLLEMVARGEPLDVMLKCLCEGVESLCQSCHCSVLLIAPGQDHFQATPAAGLPEACRDFLDRASIDGGDTPYSLAATTGAPIMATDLQNDPQWNASGWRDAMRGAGFGSSFVTPITSSSGQPTGVVAIHRTDAAVLSAAEQKIIDRFTKIAGIAIERSEADAALRARERELREALAQLAEGQRISKTGSFTSDIQQDRHRWSHEFYRIFEIDPATSPQLEAVRTRIHPDDLDVYDREIRRGVEGGGSDFEFRIVTPDAGLKHLRGVAQLIEHYAGRPIFMGAVQDVTESKVAEEALNRARSDLAHVARVATLNAMTASIAHEVSQPLSGILTNANTCVRMLAAEPPNLEGAAETARRAVRDANRAAEVIRGLREMFSRKSPDIEASDLNDLAREVIALSASELRRNRAVVQTDFAKDLPQILADRVQLQQVILNLLLNASDALTGVDDRPRTLAIQTRLLNDGAVSLAVRDSGTGFKPEAVNKLFEAFYTTKAKGMGVGLSISRSIIESHQGRLWASANDGPGATFAFSIPSSRVYAST